MPKKYSRFYQKALRVLTSDTFFYAVVALLALQAVWIAICGQYPMAFDEDFHLGIIQIYATHHSPFLHGQPSGADAFGAVARDPSYLYHYLMSFIYQPLAHLLGNTGVIIALRLCSVVLFSVGLVVFRRFLLRTGASRALVHFGLLLFVLIPIVPFLAAQINYDNLLMPLIAVALLLASDVGARLRAHGDFPVAQTAWLLVTCLLASLVKYAFLPFFAALGLYLLMALLRAYSGRWHALAPTLVGGLRSQSKWLLVGVGVCVVASAGLFFQRYGHNVISYKDPIPSCDKVLSQQECSAYGPWNRDHLYAEKKGEHTTKPTTFLHEWVYGLWFRSFFAVNGAKSNFATSRPLPIPGDTVVILAVIGVLLVLVQCVPLWRQSPEMQLSFIVIALYIAALALQDYTYYHHTGHPVAINGRYLVPVLPLIFVWVGMAYARAMRRFTQHKPTIAVIILLLMLQGGGAMTYILRSNHTWYWHNQTIITINSELRDALQRLMIDRKPSERAGSIEDRV